MATKKPRIVVTVDHEIKDLLDQIAELSEQSSASFVREVLTEAKPQMIEIVKALKSTREALNKADAERAKAFEIATKHLENSSSIAADQLSKSDRDLEEMKSKLK